MANSPKKRRRRELLRKAIKRCHLKGDFLLPTGYHSNEYFDLVPLFLNPSQLIQLVKEIETTLLAEVEFDAIGCLELAPIPLISALCFSMHKNGFVVRKQKKGYGTNKLIEGNLCEGDRVVIAEDVTSTGGSVLKAIREVKEHGCEVVKVVTVLNRQEGCNELLKEYDFVWLFTKEEVE